ncbi:hypothetical protein [Pseudomonas sp. S2_F03]
MNEQNVYANYNFIVNGEFANDLKDWIINDERKVAKLSGAWEGKQVGFMNAVNEGTGSQTITLASLPRPSPQKADYQLIFHYEAVQRAVGTLRINPGRGGEVDLRLVPSREAEPELALNPDELLLELNLVEYRHPLTLEPTETTVKFTLISPDNGGPGRPGAVRLAFVRVELLLEPLRLTQVTIDGEPQSPGEKLHLCFGNEHEVALQLVSDSAWVETLAGLLVNDGVNDPEGILDASPPWGTEHPVSDPWTISCAGIVEDKEIEHTLGVRSQYTADVYPLDTVSGHFQLDVIPLLEATYYPVIDLNQTVELRARVASHFTKTPLANREVTWTLIGQSPEDDIVLFRQFSDVNGDAGFTWTPETEGDWVIEASVDSHYKKEDARFAFKGRALKEDPWLSATFALDGSSREWGWGTETGYPCRGATHQVALAFAAGHLLADTELALHWVGDDTPEGLEMGFTPALESFNPVAGPGKQWTMVCSNKRDSQFGFKVSCSKLLRASPIQSLKLAHNRLAVGEVKLPTRFPTVGGADLQLEIQILSLFLNEGERGVSGIDVKWRVDGGPEQVLRTGEYGWCVYPFSPVTEGPVTITARVDSPYDGQILKREFKVTVLAEDPWSKLVTVTLNGRAEENIGLLCFRNDDPVELRIMPRDGPFLDEFIYLDLVSDEGAGLDFHFEPAKETPRKLTGQGLSWMVSSTSDISAPFQLFVCHEELAPYELQGRLLSKTLDGEGTFKLDEKELDLTGTAYPCLGGQHILSFTPSSGSLLNGLEVAAKWADGANPALNVGLTPDDARDLNSEGLEWTLDASTSIESGALGVALELPQALFTFAPLNMSLAHNRLVISEVRGPTFDPFVGETVLLEIKAQSYYTQRSVPGVDVSFSHGGTSVLVPTRDDGWARFPFKATQPGVVTVVATVPSPYDGTDDFPSCSFDFTVLAAVVSEAGSSTVSPSTTFANEAVLMSEKQESGPINIEIGEVREAKIDPVVGEYAQLGLKVRHAGTRRAATGVEVTFTVEEKHTRVVTNGEGWASFAYRGEKAGDVVVIATLESVSDRAEADLSHTFNIKVLTAGVWDDALIQLNNEAIKTIWGAQTLFPRITSPHTIKLSVDNSNSHLLGRNICLGVKGYSSPRELGLNTNPGLGVPRLLTESGLSWQLTGTIGGAYGLQLEASRLLKLSPVSAMSLGPVPPVVSIEA